ncbi:ATP synthase F1 subunit delta [Desulfonatronum thiosulfatophilum]|uniref:ATP synthase F1 subunit delta n=1 Tax=Desulfonatronum thiosulfatophilum TaxID=617002 RepID=UPI000B825642|nr:ATP synthase F1 subunit delta [Desulfonatronum thiosulfatophilum]
MIGNLVARRYARALFSLGLAQGDAKLVAYGENLSGLVEALNESPQLDRIFRNPVFKVAEKKAVVDAILSKIKPQQMIVNFCHLLADNNRLGFLADIQAYYAELLDEHQGIARGKMITAIDLEPEIQAQLKNSLEEKTSRQLILDYAVDPQILGGLILKIGDRVLDASLRAQLVAMRETIKRGE